MYISPFLLMAFLAVFSISAHADLSLEKALTEALAHDHWLVSNQYQEQAIRSGAIASGQLPDPKLRIALANLPTDSFDFNQENMTQLQFGVSQQFPRGDSLEIKQRQLNLMADQKQLERDERKALIKKKVGQLWVQLHQYQEQIKLLVDNQHIFNELLTISQANYRSGKIQGYELLDAELKLTQLQDRIAKLEQLKNQTHGRLSEWLTVHGRVGPLSSELPEIKMILTDEQLNSEDKVYQALLRHPVLQRLEQGVDIQQKAVDLADEAYEPSFKIDANYGYRDDMSTGIERSDFFSMAVTFDLPIFPEKRQDAHRNAAINLREAAKEQRLLNARQMKSTFDFERANLAGLEQRIIIYNRGFLRQLKEKRIAALKAYGASTARFADISAAAISELEVKLQKVALLHERASTLFRLNYLLAGVDPELRLLSPRYLESK
ncbi:TolC family protein [Neptuniibacter sp. 1_MG-2023]|jgi:outer membrane protein TolC|uniref:TolC family protein n=1 Tax=Neptuniibacter sp. 1_MG-2023 TaxID=3062662 RepID=UPI0026E402F0|nr:TolC family protein [Neptuniibacter sp. 1_MG-2023]MDO6593073.1 TolC family protein [Neptuniibacter sp. 1_MG-2023]